MALNVNVEVRGLRQLRRRLSSYDASVQRGVRSALVTAGNAAVSEAKTRIQRGPHGNGRIYRRRRSDGSVVEHQASAPGFPPASDLGGLASSTRLDRSEINNLTVILRNDLKYAAYLESGTRTMAARPVFVPAAQAQVQQLIQDIQVALRP